jgi:6-phosphogluconolactonase
VVMNNVPQMNARRMTLTFPVLNAARRVWILCAGSDKKPVLDRLAASAALPIGRVRPEGELIWWLARSAAGLPPE